MSETDAVNERPSTALELRELLKSQDPAFFQAMRVKTAEARQFSEVLADFAMNGKTSWDLGLFALSRFHIAP